MKIIYNSLNKVKPKVSQVSIFLKNRKTESSTSNSIKMKEKWKRLAKCNAKATSNLYQIKIKF